MIMVRAPFRTSFLGGGSDLPFFYQLHGGATLSTTINKHIFLTGRRMYNGNQSLLKYSQIERVNSADDIKHPIFRAVFEIFKLKGVDLAVMSDIPSGSGLGSSSSFTVGLIKLVNELHGLQMDEEEIARLACEIEIDKVGDSVGKQDQYSSAFGGLNLFLFNRDNSVEVLPYQFNVDDYEWLSGAMVLVEVGSFGRSANENLKKFAQYMGSDDVALHSTKALADLAIEGFKQISTSGIRELPSLLGEAWRLKQLSAPRELTSVASELMNLGLENGALAGKLLGAGGGGFILFLVEPESVDGFQISLGKVRSLRVKPDLSGVLTIYNEGNEN